MEFECWEPIYSEILDSFGYSRAGDEHARDVLTDLLVEKELYDPAQLDWTGKTVAIAGGADSLNEEFGKAQSADVVVAASIGADVLREQGIGVDCMVTDLDKNPETVVDLATEGTPVAVHAHGDNVPAVKRVVPALSSQFLIPTTQAAPKGPVRNFGGFTDGDRAAYLADWAGAAELVFPGWDFDDPSVDDEKAKKLAWAERLLFGLEEKRGERFDLLDGRRDQIEKLSAGGNG